MNYFQFSTKIMALLVVLLGLAITHSVSAQEVQSSQEATLEGTVVDASNNQPLENVTVEIPQMNKEATTDKDGKFIFQNIGSDTEAIRDITLVISHDGYKKFSKTVMLGQASDLTLELEPKSEIQ